MPGRVKNRSAIWGHKKDTPKRQSPSAIMEVYGATQSEFDAQAAAADAWCTRAKVHMTDDDVDKWLDMTYGSSETTPGMSAITNAIPMSVKLVDESQESDVALFTLDMKLSCPETEEATTIQMGDVVPRYWIPYINAGTDHAMNAETFWEYLKGTPPQPAILFLDHPTPFWKLYPAMKADFLPEIVHLDDVADDLAIDPCETYKERQKRVADLGIAHTVEQWLTRRAERQQAQRDVAQRERRRRDASTYWPTPGTGTLPLRDRGPHPTSNNGIPSCELVVAGVQSELSLKLRTNILIRLANDLDIPQISDLYNHYVESSTSCVVPDPDRVTNGAMLRRMRDIQEAGFPFLVAVELRTIPSTERGWPQRAEGIPSINFQPPSAPRGGHGGRRGRGRGRGGVRGGRGGQHNYSPGTIPPENNSLSDSGGRILGMIYADDYNSPRGLYCFTSELELFVAPTHLCQGIGSCLLDAFFPFIDNFYSRKGGYEMAPGVSFPQMSRRVKSLLMQVPFFMGERPRWMLKWLEEKWGWTIAGTVEEGGIKLGRRIDWVVMQRKTREEIYEPEGARFLGKW